MSTGGVDRGGLDYTITIVDDGIATLKGFKSAIQDLRDSLDGLKTDLAGLSKPTSAGQAAVTAKATATAQAQAVNAKTAAGLNNLTAASNTATTSGNNLFFTFRRLFGVLAAFTVARKVVGFFTDLIAGTIEANANIEQLTLGIGAIIAAVGTVRDATGAQVSAAQSLSLGQAEARRQLGLLRTDALQTTATFEQLAGAFQTALAPGLNAGLSVDNIRKVVVEASQAALAVGATQNQLPTELRQILSGTIQGRTNKIAVGLGITNEDIQRAKEAGTLVQLLDTRFSAFNEAGKETANTFEGLLTNVKSAFSLLATSAGLGFFDSVKGILRDVQNLITKKNSITGLLEPSPKAVEFFRIIADGLKVAVNEADLLVKRLNFNDAATLAKSFVASIKTGAQVVSAIIEGVIRGGASLAALFQKLGINIDLTDWRELLVLLVQIATIVFGLKSSLGLLNGLVGIFKGGWSLVYTAIAALLSPLKTVSDGITTLTTGVAGLSVPFVAILASLAVGSYFLQQWADKVLGVKATMGQIVDLAQSKINQKTSNFLNDPIGETGAFIDRAGQGLAIALRSIDLLVQKATGANQTVIDRTQKMLDIAVANEQADENKGVGTNAALRQNTQANFDADKDQIKKGTFDSGTLSKILTSTFAALKTAWSDIFTIPKIDFPKQPGEEVKSMSDLIEGLPPVIERGTEAFELQATVIKKIGEDLRKAKEDLTTELATVGLSGPILKQRSDLLQAEADARKQNQAFRNEQKETEGDINGLKTDQLDIETKILSFGKDQQDTILQAITLSRSLLTIKRQIADAEQGRRGDVGSLQIAQTSGDPAAITAAKSKVSNDADNIATLQQAFDLTKADLNALVEKGKLTEQQRTIVIDTVGIAGRLVGLDEQRKSLIQAQLETLNGMYELQANKLRVLAIQDIQQLNQGLGILQAQVKAVQALAGVRQDLVLTPKASPELRRNVEAQSAVSINAEEQTAAEAQRQRDEAALTAQLASLKTQRDSLTTQISSAPIGSDTSKLRGQLATQNDVINDTLTEQGLVLQKNNLEREAAITKTKELNDTLIETADILNNQVSSGIKAGFIDVLNSVPSTFQTIRDVIVSTMQQTADTVADLFASAFDKNKKVDIRQRIAQLFDSVASDIIKQLTKVILSKAFISIFGSVGSFGAPAGQAFGSLGVGGWTGGVASKQGVAKGFAYGGTPDGPFGRAPNTRDRIPVWVESGEHITRASSARKYGYDAMAAINAGLVDPKSLRALAGLGGSRSASKAPSNVSGSRNRSYQAPDAASGALGIPGISVAVVPPSEVHLDRLLHGGKAALLKFMADNKSAVNGALGN